MARIELRGVTKRYEPEHGVTGMLRRHPSSASGDAMHVEGNLLQGGALAALDNLSLIVEDGRTLVVVGPSGCGKSTLLRVIAGLTDYEGLVAYDGIDMRTAPPGDRHIGMVFQDYALYPHFYGQGNLRFFFQVNRAPDSEAEERIRATSELMGFGFKELLKRKPGTLSGGQQQRLAIARAIVRQPKLFLFDEPLSNLDAKLRTRTRAEIKRLLHRFGITAIYVTHDQTEAMALADRVAVMRRGRIEQTGTFAEILNNPTNAFVAGFLGTPPMNLIAGNVAGTWVVFGAEQRVPIPERLRSRVTEGQRVTVGIRPADVRIRTDEHEAPGARSSEGTVLAGRIDVVEPDFGRRQQTAYVTTEAFSCRVIAPLDIPLTVGYQTQMMLPPTALFFFDGDTGERLK